MLQFPSPSASLLRFSSSLRGRETESESESHSPVLLSFLPASVALLSFKGFDELLAQLSHCPPLPDVDFRAHFADIAALGDDHVVCVVKDLRAGRIIATGSVFIEKKFLRGCGMVGHIEDVVVDAAVRGRRLDQRMVRYLVEHARAVGCYKVILDCESDRRAFYEKCGFTEKSIQMALYF